VEADIIRKSIQVIQVKLTSWHPIVDETKIINRTMAIIKTVVATPGQ